MQSAFQQCLSRIDTKSVVAEFISQELPVPMTEVFEEQHHVVALQQTLRPGLSEGRYRLPEGPGHFTDIGRLIVMPAELPLEVRSAGGLRQAVRCVFPQSVLEEYGSSCDLYDRHILSSCLNLRHRGIAEILQRLRQELQSPGLASVALTEALGTTLVIELARHINDHPRQPMAYRGGLTRQKLRMITDYVEAHESCPSLSDLSDLTGISLRHLTRAFKQTTGGTVYAYIEQVRYQKAQSLLADSDLLMKDIAHRLGFSCSSSFSVAFRKIAGEAPQDYRKRMRAMRSYTMASKVRH